jgi:hypothetical protein
MLFALPIFTKLVSVQCHCMKMSYIIFCPNKKKNIHIYIKHNPNFSAVIKFSQNYFCPKLMADTKNIGRWVIGTRNTKLKSKCQKVYYLQQPYHSHII